MINLAKRSEQLELIDTESPGYDEWCIILNELELINKLTFAYSPTIKAIDRTLKARHEGQQRPVKVLDVGFGYGDVLRRLARRAVKKKYSFDLTGFEINPWAVKVAREVTPAEMKIRYLTSNIFEENLKESYDIIINSLFTHHLKSEEIIKLVQWMCCHAKYGWVINDLHRHRIPYYFIKYFTRFLRFNRCIINDAPLSVARSFVRSDWESIIKNANIDFSNVSISWHWPFRYCVSYMG